MKFATRSGKISAQSNATCWGGCFVENGIFVLLEVAGDDNYPAPKAGRELLDRLLEKFTQFRDRSLDVVKKLLNEFKNVDSIKTLTIGLLKDDILYLGNIGLGKVFIQRRGAIGELLLPGENISGRVRKDDVFLFTSTTFEQVIENSDIRKLLQIKDPQEAVEKAAPGLLDNPYATGAAALSLIFTFKPDEKEDISNLPASGLTDTLPTVWQKLFRKNQLKEVVDRILSFPSERQIDGKREKTKKTLLTVATILIILLISSIFFNINFTSNSEKKAKLEETLSLVAHQYEEAVNLVDLNPVRARTLLSNAKLSLSPFLDDFPKNSKEAKLISQWLEKISQQEVAAYNIFKLTQVPLFYDLTLLKKEGEGTRIASYREKKAILDTKNKVIYILSTDTKQAEILAGEKVVKDTYSIAIHGEDVYIVNQEGIAAINLETKESKTEVKKDKDWGEIVDIAAFAGNLYLLDRRENSIWKYTSTDTGFSSKRNYLAKGLVVDFSGKNILIIDGSVYVSGEREILKFHQGTYEPFAFQGISDTISGPLDLFTSDIEENLYVLDRPFSRILVFDKDGQYQAQYQWEELKNADDFVVSEEERKIFILFGSKIYSMDLK